MPSIVPLVKRAAYTRGVTGSSSKWLGAWVLISTAQFVRRRLKEPVKVERIVLKPGQTIEIRDTGVTRGSLKKR